MGVYEVKFREVCQLPVIIIDNFYTEEECESIWQELCFLNSGNKLLESDKTGSATDDDGNILKKNKGIFLDQAYKIRKFSSILTLNRKIFEVSNDLSEKISFFKYLKNSNYDATLIQYYENSDYYKLHEDESLITALTWFFKKPKSFTGGNLIFEDNSKIDCEYNRIVIFPSIIKHGVENVNLSSDLHNQNLGRYSISQFISICV
jgi:Rps23 Pro-64 3,4-dihydroxylase Tpa1-like proline 4-hydroxylase